MAKLSGLTCRWTSCLGRYLWEKMNQISNSVFQMSNYSSVHPQLTYPNLFISSGNRERLSSTDEIPGIFMEKVLWCGRWSFVIKPLICLEYISAFGVKWESAYIFSQIDRHLCQNHLLNHLFSNWVDLSPLSYCIYWGLFLESILFHPLFISTCPSIVLMWLQWLYSMFWLSAGASQSHCSSFSYIF